MAFKFDLRGFLITRKSDDAEPKKVNITNNYFNAEKEEVTKPIMLRNDVEKKPIHLKSPNVIPYTRQTSNEEPQQPTGLLNKYRQYQLKKIEKKQLASDVDLLQENEKQTKLLEEIAKKGSSENNSKGWLSALLGGLLASNVAKIIKPLIGIMALLSGMKLLGGLGSKAKGGVVPSSKNKKAKAKGGILGKGLKGIAKKAGAIGMVISGIEGISDYKEWKGLSKEHNTTFREKITGTLGGIANGFNDFVEFASMGTVDLFEKDEAFEVIDNVTSNIKQASESMLSRFPTVQASINLFTDGVNGLLNKSADGFKNIYDLSKEAIRTKTKDEKEFVNANNARTLVQTELEDGQNFFEGNDEWNKRKNELEKKLYKLKEEEYKKAKKALENSDFRENSIHKYEAVIAVQEKEMELILKDTDKKKKWIIEKNEVQEKLEKVVSDRKAFQEQLKDKTLSDNERKMLSLKIDSYAIAMNNLANELNEVMKKKPTVRRVEPYDLDSLSANQNINHADINKNKINTLTSKKGGSLSWRNNNVGNLMSMYDGRINPVSGKVTKSKRSYDQALSTMQKKYNGVIALDRYGSLVFDTKEHGEEAQKQLLKSKSWSSKTIEKAISAYAPSGDSNDTASYIQSVSKSIGVNKKTKLEDLTQEQFESMFLAIKKVEGYKVGTTIPMASTATISKKATALTPQRNESIIAKAQTIKANQSKPIIVKQPIDNQPPLQNQEAVKNKQEIIEKVVNKPTIPTFPQQQPIVEPRVVVNLNQESLKESI